MRVITDTDAKNEADDAFAIVQTLLSPKLDNVGFIAAHFGKRVDDSMQKSYDELGHIFDIMSFDKANMIYKGGEAALKSKDVPRDSEGARLIIREAMKDDSRPLFVTFMGPLTDLASAYLLEPRIASRLTAIWIGGGEYPHGGAEFNLENDIIAANVVFGSKIELWQVPKNVYEMMPVSLAELEHRVRPCGKIGEYLCEQLESHSFESAPLKSAFRTGESWVLGDNPAVGLILYEMRYECKYISAPYITSDMAYIHTGVNRALRVYERVDSRLILEDMYAKLALFAKNNQH